MQAQQPALWIVDMAPVLMGLIAYTLGRRLDRASRQSAALREQVHELSRMNEILRGEFEEHSRLEEQVRQSQKMEAIGQLAGGVAHDFNNLLTAILGYADMLTELIEPADTMAGYVAEIRKTGERAAGLVQQLLGFSRRQMAQPRTVDLAAVIEESRSLLSRVIGEHVRIDVISPGKPVSVYIDPFQVDQILVNLVVNARDAMPDGGVVTIRSGVRVLSEADCEGRADASPGRYCFLEVVDTGVGMEESTIDRIFEPFFTTKGRAKGTGLGLSTVYGIVKQNAGFIDVRSHLGAGTTFRIHFAEAAPGPSTPEEPDEKVTGRPGAECILLVEDEDVVRRLTAQALGRYGYDVLEARDAEEAMGIWRDRSGEIDLLVTDVVMPGSDGKQLFLRLSAQRPEMPVVFMSGYDEEIVVEHGVLDDRPFIAKPFTIEGLSVKVREALDARAS
jgi:two-component system cell cycle sensor histidine kinase/response regulator CckA